MQIVSWFQPIAVCVITVVLVLIYCGRGWMVRRKRYLDFLLFDLSLATKKFEQNWGFLLTECDAGQVHTEFCRYMYLVAKNPGVQFGMQSDLVDKYWHEVICCTALYRDFCNTLAGRFIDHAPGTFSPKAYAITWMGYRTTFEGDPPPSIWPLPDLAEVERLKMYRAGSYSNSAAGGPLIIYDVTQVESCHTDSHGHGDGAHSDGGHGGCHAGCCGGH